MNELDNLQIAPVDSPPPAPVEPQAPPVADPAPPPEPERFSIKHGGQERQLTRDELIEHAQKGFDYTQKAQDLANQRKLVEQVANVLATERSRMQQVFQDRAALQARLQELGPEIQQAGPDEVPTIEQAQALIKEQVDAARRQILTEVESAQFKAETARMEQGYRSEIDSAVKTITEKFPTLIEWLDPSDVDGLLRSAAAKFVNDAIRANPMEAVQITAVKDAMIDAAKLRAEKIDKKVADQKKMQAVRDAKLTKEGIEPPGGTPPPPPAPTRHKLGSAELTKSVTEELAAAFAAKG